MLELIFKYSQSEYVKAYRQYLIASKTISIPNIIILVLAIAFSSAFAIMSKLDVWSVALLVTCFFVLLIGIILYFLTPIHIFKSTAKFHEEYYLAFSDEKIIFKTATIDSELAWETYTKIWDNKDFYYLIQHPKIYTIIPKRAFLNEEAMQNFERLAESKLKEFKHI